MQWTEQNPELSVVGSHYDERATQRPVPKSGQLDEVKEKPNAAADYENNRTRPLGILEARI
jgi:hypothetical protein